MMTISSNFILFFKIMWYNLSGDSMNNTIIVKDFEENRVKIILNLLLQLNEFNLYNQIMIMNNKILSNLDKLIFDDFDFKTHLNALLRFARTYKFIMNSKFNNKFIEELKTEFYIYWSKIKNFE